jgi:hypothetical protein
MTPTEAGHDAWIEMDEIAIAVLPQRTLYALQMI